jgi:hypothetical protein
MSKQETSTPTAAAPSPEPSVAHPSPSPAPAPSPATAASEASVDGSRAAASSSAAAAGDVPGDGAGDAPPVKQANPNRCYSCNKRVGFTGFECRCGFTYCATHRHANKHECSFDFKAMGRDAVAKANPAVIAEKVDKVRDACFGFVCADSKANDRFRVTNHASFANATRVFSFATPSRLTCLPLLRNTFFFLNADLTKRRVAPSRTKTPRTNAFAKPSVASNAWR